VFSSAVRWDNANIGKAPIANEQVTKMSKHQIIIRFNDTTQLYDVLTNGVSYRIHQGKELHAARECAYEIQRQFRAMGQGATVAHEGEPAQFSEAR